MTNHSDSAFLAASARAPAVDRLRAFVILLVIAHHAALAYLPQAPEPGAFAGSDLTWAAFPVVDAARARGLEALVLWNESFFMGLMFLLSGLFVAPSLRRKGAGRFLRERALRLGAPFAVGALALAPLAYLPAYLQRADASGDGGYGGASEPTGYMDAWLALGSWPSGPVWFLWALLAFGALAASLHRAWPGALDGVARLGEWGRERPVRLCMVFMVTVVAAYVAATRVASPFAWWHWGPFFAQTSRLPLYALYFLFGVAVGGSGGSGGGLLARDGRLARNWLAWAAAAGAAFAVLVAALRAAFADGGGAARALSLDLAANAAFAATGVATSFALLALFARRAGPSGPLWDSLSRNAFGMYLIHYGLVSWMQWALLDVGMPAWGKFAAVFAAAAGASWAGAAALRRMPGARRVV